MAVAALRALREEEAEVAAQLRSWEAAEAVSVQASWSNGTQAGSLGHDGHPSGAQIGPS